jgi:hypothetical protein
MATLDELENRLKSLLELTLVTNLPGSKAEDKVYQQLAKEMFSNLKVQAGIKFAPNVFVVRVHPKKLSQWKNESNLVRRLAEALQIAGKEAGFHFMTDLIVTLIEDTHVSITDTRIIASYSGENVEKTEGIPTPPVGESTIESFPLDAVLILGAKKTIPLELPVINIGRRLDNQIVIDDKSVSRIHAQIRWSNGYFTLFDLDSKAGTFVNNHRINKAILHPGDVIALADVILIYYQGQMAEKENEIPMTETRPNTPSQIPQEMNTSSDLYPNRKGKEK